jgi:FAD/FMN-containing dehydrogenase
VSEGVVKDLVSIVGPEHVLTDPETTASYAIDWTGRFRGHTPIVVRPATTEEVAAIVARCARDRLPVVTQGGNTGLVGGGVPLAGEIVMSLRRLSHLDAVDLTAAQVTAGAGVTIATLQDHAADAGLAYGVDLAARDSATVGGTIATNAGGLHVLRWGDTRRQLLGVEAVLADGSVVRHLGGLPKDNTGYHLPGLLCGSEGTLGVITAARLRLVPRYAHRVVALIGFGSVAAAVEAVSGWRRWLGTLEAAEIFFDDGLRLVCHVEQLPPPFPSPSPVYVLVEAADSRDPTDALAAAVGRADGVDDVAVGIDERTRRSLWAYREGHTLAINTLGAPHKFDVTLPLGEMARFVDDVREAITAAVPAATTWIFGHVGDGNLHVNVTGVAADDERVDDAVFTLVASRAGSISAEHGIGTAKKRWLHLNRSGAEIAAFRAIKQALDPLGILNPHALLP